MSATKAIHLGRERRPVAHREASAVPLELGPLVVVFRLGLAETAGRDHPGLAPELIEACELLRRRLEIVFCFPAAQMLVTGNGNPGIRSDTASTTKVAIFSWMAMTSFLVRHTAFKRSASRKHSVSLSTVRSDADLIDEPALQGRVLVALEETLHALHAADVGIALHAPDLAAAQWFTLTVCAAAGDASSDRCCECREDPHVTFWWGRVIWGLSSRSEFGSALPSAGGSECFGGFLGVLQLATGTGRADNMPDYMREATYFYFYVGEPVRGAPCQR